MFPKNAWYNAGWDYMFTQSQKNGLSQSKGSLVARKIANERVVLYRKPTGQIVAMEDRCPHRQAALSLGQKEGDGIRCMYHGMRFGPDGKCNEIPGQETIPERACVRVFPVVEKDNWVWVWMGDPAKADEKLIPHAVGPSHPDWNVKTSHMSVKANFRLEIANLADLTHLVWIHKESLGAGDKLSRERFTTIKPKFTMLPNAMRTQYCVRGAPTSVFLQHLFPEGALFDWDFDIMHTLPCTWVLHFKIFVADGKLEGEPTGPLVAETWTCQAVTPCDEDSVEYYYSWGASKATDFPGLSQLLCDNLDDAFTEDRHALEAQHVRMKEKPNAPMVDIIHDAGPGKMLWLLDKVLKDEAKQAAMVAA